MIRLTFLLRWGWVLLMALVGPAWLPAGGSDLHNVQIFRRYDSRPLFAGNRCILRTSPSIVAPSLCSLEIGTPLVVLRSWQSPDGRKWLRVKANSKEPLHVVSVVKRGWIDA